MCYETQITKYDEVWLEAIISRDRCSGFNLGTDFAEAAYIDKWGFYQILTKLNFSSRAWNLIYG